MYNSTTTFSSYAIAPPLSLEQAQQNRHSSPSHRLGIQSRDGLSGEDLIGVVERRRTGGADEFLGAVVLGENWGED